MLPIPHWRGRGERERKPRKLETKKIRKRIKLETAIGHETPRIIVRVAEFAYNLPEVLN